MSNWREDKKFVEDFMKLNENIINSTNFFHIMKKTKHISWKDIKEDLISQYEKVKKILSNEISFKNDQAEESRRRSEEITEDIKHTKNV